MKITLNSPLDMHVHLRDGEMLNNVAPYSSKCFAGAIVMPNILPPVTTLEEVRAYKNRILKAIGEDKFEPYMTLFFKNNWTYEFLKEAKHFIKAVKLYPSGITTNSENGVSDFKIENLKPTLEAMSDLNIPLLVHGETNGFVMDREKEFGVFYKKIALAFPKLKIIMEHITDRNSVKLLKEIDNLYATITLHHLLLTFDDVAGGKLKPHLFCKPIAKRYEDKEALLELALNAYPKIMFGSDSAPHPQNKKESNECAAGIWTAPIALPALCELFEKYNKLDNLQKFVSDNAQNIYNFKPIEKKVVLEKGEFLVPEKYNNVVPMFAGKKLSWKCN